MGNTWLNKPGGPLYDPLRQAVTKKLFKPDVPATPAAPIPTAPQEPNNQSSMQIQDQLRMQQNRRRSVASTIYAGGGGYQGAMTAPSTGGSRTKTG